MVDDQPLQDESKESSAFENDPGVARERVVKCHYFERGLMNEAERTRRSLFPILVLYKQLTVSINLTLLNDALQRT